MYGCGVSADYSCFRYVSLHFVSFRFVSFSIHCKRMNHSALLLLPFSKSFPSFKMWNLKFFWWFASTRPLFFQSPFYLFLWSFFLSVRYFAARLSASLQICINSTVVYSTHIWLRWQNIYELCTCWCICVRITVKIYQYSTYYKHYNRRFGFAYCCWWRVRVKLKETNEICLRSRISFSLHLLILHSRSFDIFFCLFVFCTLLFLCTLHRVAWKILCYVVAYLILFCRWIVK